MDTWYYITAYINRMLIEKTEQQVRKNNGIGVVYWEISSINTFSGDYVINKLLIGVITRPYLVIIDFTESTSFTPTTW